MQIFLVGTAHVSKASTDEVQSMIRAVKPQTVFVEVDNARAERLMRGQEQKGSLQARLVSTSLCHLQMLLPCLQSKLRAVCMWLRAACMSHAKASLHFLQYFFAKIAAGTGINIPQELLKQGLAGRDHARPADAICFPSKACAVPRLPSFQGDTLCVTMDRLL